MAEALETAVLHGRTLQPGRCGSRSIMAFPAPVCVDREFWSCEVLGAARLWLLGCSGVSRRATGCLRGLVPLLLAVDTVQQVWHG